MKRTTAEPRSRLGSRAAVGEQRLYWLRFKAGYFFQKTAGFLSNPSNAPAFHGTKRRTAYDLTRDPDACKWIRKFIGELIMGCEHARLHSLKAMPTGSEADRRWDQLLRKRRRRGLTHVLHAERFPVQRVLPLVERLLDVTQSPTHVPEGHQSILRQLPSVLAHLRRESKRGYRQSYAPPGSTTLRVPASVLQAYLDALPTVFQQLMRAWGVDTSQRGRPGQLPLASGLIHADAPRGFRSCGAELHQLYDILKTTGSTAPRRARLAWLLDITRVWPFHPIRPISSSMRVDGVLQTGLTATPAGYFPVTGPRDLQVCGSCRKRADGPRTCARRSEIFRRFIKDLMRRQSQLS